MLHMLLERGEDVSDVIFFDGGWEFPEMYDHLEQVEKNTGLTITRLKPEKPFDYWFAEHHVNSRKEPGKIGYGWPGPISRWCTALKRNTIDKYKHTLIYDSECIGFAVGEERRIRNKPKHRYPLIEWGITEKQALIYCKRLGYNWGGLYDVLDRVSCFCCPFMSRTTLYNLKHFRPDIWDKIEALADKCPDRCFKEKLTFSEYKEMRLAPQKPGEN